MLKNHTSINGNSGRIIGGDGLIAENGPGGTSVSFNGEMPLPDIYRGNFHSIMLENNQITVGNTALNDEFETEMLPNGGDLILRWNEIILAADGETYYSKPRAVKTTAPVMPAMEINSSGWIILKMTRVQGGGDFSFQDAYLGSVCVDFSWHFAPELPAKDDKSDYLAVAAVIADDGVLELIQQQFGIGTLWIPLLSEVVDDEESSSSSSSGSDLIGPDFPDDDDGNDDEIIPDNQDIPVDMTFYYYEESTGDFAGLGFQTTMICTFDFSGSFVAKHPYNNGGYKVTLTGTESYDYGDGEPPVVKNATMEITVLRNDQLSRWEVFNGQVAGWMEYMSGINNDDDCEFHTPVYTFPYADTSQYCPRGTIRVKHDLTYGRSQTPPENKLESDLIITFTAV